MSHNVGVTCFPFCYNDSRCKNIYVKIPRKFHNHEAQPSRGTQRWRDDEHMRTIQTPYMKPQTHKKKNCNRGTALERSNQFYSRETSPLIVTQLQITNICSVHIGSYTSSVKRHSETRIIKTTVVKKMAQWLSSDGLTRPEARTQENHKHDHSKPNHSHW